jgi:hypothetical protein
VKEVSQPEKTRRHATGGFSLSVRSVRRGPGHQEFRPSNAWSLFTEAHKGINPQTIIARGQALHGLFDGLVGIN